MRLLLIGAVCISSSVMDFEFDEKLINPFTREVYYRYYLIKRMRRADAPIYIIPPYGNILTSISFPLNTLKMR